MQNFVLKEFCNTMRDFRSGSIDWVGLHMNIPVLIFNILMKNILCQALQSNIEKVFHNFSNSQ